MTIFPLKFQLLIINANVSSLSNTLVCDQLYSVAAIRCAATNLPISCANSLILHILFDLNGLTVSVKRSLFSCVNSDEYRIESMIKPKHLRVDDIKSVALVYNKVKPLNPWVGNQSLHMF